MDWFALALTLGVLDAFLVENSSLPDAAPEWTLSSLDGETVSLSDYEGQTVVLNLGNVVWSMQNKSRFRQFANEHRIFQYQNGS